MNEDEYLKSYKEWWADYLRRINESDELVKMNLYDKARENFTEKACQALGFESTEFKKPEHDYRSEFKRLDYTYETETKPRSMAGNSKEWWFPNNTTTCEGCKEGGFGYDELDRNMLCEKCVKKSTSKETGVKLGDPEAAFFFTNVDMTAPEVVIIKAVNYLQCPGAGRDGFIHCGYDISHLEPIDRRREKRMPLYRMLFEHYRDKHYDLLLKDHSKFQNLVYAILQELTIYELSTKRIPPRLDNDQKHQIRNRRCITIHNLVKHLQIPLAILAFTLRLSQGVVGDMAFTGITLCKVCYK